MQAIQEKLQQLSALEMELSSSKFLLPSASAEEEESSSSSPKSIDNTALIQRYEQARDLYLQRRLENLLVDHIATFDGESMEFPQVEDHSNTAQLQERHQQAFQTLQESLTNIHSQVDQLKQARDAVQSRRQELECMIQDLQNEEDVDEGSMMEEEDADETTAAALLDDPAALEEEQARIEALQQRKRQLQEKLEQVKRQAKEAQDRARAKQEAVELLQRERAASTGTTQEQITQEKVQELVEMKEFYDSLRLVLEELGGVKIVKVEEVALNGQEKASQLCLSLVFCDEFPVDVTLQVYRKVFLKGVDAQWKSLDDKAPVVQAVTKDYELPLDPLQDLVQTAISTLGPPHDLRFIVRETLARIRLTQERVNQLAELRHHNIMKLYGNQVTCSLNEGIVIVMRLYEKYIVLENLVGINGWDDTAVQDLKNSVQDRLDTEYAQDDANIALFGSKITPLLVVELVQEEIRRASANPLTPRMPVRGGTAKNGF